MKGIKIDTQKEMTEDDRYSLLMDQNNHVQFIMDEIAEAINKRKLKKQKKKNKKNKKKKNKKKRSSSES